MAVQLYNSPIFSRNNRLPERFERKFYVYPNEIGLAYNLLHQICIKDRDFYSEQINSLYFDSVNLDQHEKSTSGDYRKDKIRIRWYGKELNKSGTQIMFVERKSRYGFAGTKQRMKLEIPVEKLEADNLHRGIIPRYKLMEILAGYGYYPWEILQPVIKISYWRYRFSEVITGQRVSLDCHINSTMILPGPGNGEKNLELPGAVIEIKGEKMELPVTLMRARILDTDWTRFSKYSASLDAHHENPGTIGRLSPSGKVVEYTS